MINNYYTIKWFNTKDNIWITDYISDTIEEHCIISCRHENTDKYSFIMTRKLSKDIQWLLEHSMKLVYLKNFNLRSDIKIINLGFNCSENLVRGNFDVVIS